MNGTVARLPLGELRVCEFCEEGHVSAAMVSQEFQYGEGDAAVVLNAYVPVWTCDSCGEQFTDGAAERIRHDIVCEHLGRLTPDEIKASRKSAGYSQDAWADFSRLGVASIKRWESGSQIQSASADLLLRLLDDEDVRDRLIEKKSVCGTRGAPTFQAIMVEQFSKQAAQFQLRPSILN